MSFFTGTLLLLAYVLVLLLFARGTARLHPDADAFFVNRRSTSSFGVALSIVASCVGGSATLGMAGLAWQAGTPALWWLGAGAAGLTILGLFLAATVRRTGAATMPEMVGTYLGPSLRPLVSVIIVTAWLAILAAQISAFAAIAASITGLEPRTLLIPVAAFIVLYASLGGQATVMRGDAFQMVFMAGTLLAACVWLFMHNWQVLDNVPLELVNTDFPLSRASYFLVIIGGSYVVCPMLFGRLLSAGSSRAARNGALMGAAGLLLMAVLIVTLGLLCRGLVPADIASEQVLATVFKQNLPGWLSGFVLLGLCGAVLSSADSCLVTAATVLCGDILRRPDARTCRWCLVAIGIGGLVLAAPGRGILHLLLMANDIYVCGVVVPVFVGMLLHGRRALRESLLTVAVATGGLFGLAAAITGNNDLSYAGIAAAFVLTVLSARKLSEGESASSKSFVPSVTPDL